MNRHKNSHPTNPLHQLNRQELIDEKTNTSISINTSSPIVYQKFQVSIRVVKEDISEHRKLVCIATVFIIELWK